MLTPTRVPDREDVPANIQIPGFSSLYIDPIFPGHRVRRPGANPMLIHRPAARYTMSLDYHTPGESIRGVTMSSREMPVSTRFHQGPCRFSKRAFQHRMSSWQGISLSSPPQQSCRQHRHLVTSRRPPAYTLGRNDPRHRGPPALSMETQGPELEDSVPRAIKMCYQCF
jgi:hypothetical protein